MRQELLQIIADSLNAIESGTDPKKVTREIHARTSVLLDQKSTLEKELDDLVSKGKRSNKLLYKNRTNRAQTAEEFCRESYGRYMDAGIFSRDKLRKLDSYLMHKIYIGGVLNLPRKSDLIDESLVGVDSKSLMRALSNVRRRVRKI